MLKYNYRSSAIKNLSQNMFLYGTHPKTFLDTRRPFILIYQLYTWKRIKYVLTHVKIQLMPVWHQNKYISKYVPHGFPFGYKVADSI